MFPSETKIGLIIAAVSFLLLFLAATLTSMGRDALFPVALLLAILLGQLGHNVRQARRKARLNKYGIEANAHIVNLWKGWGRGKGQFAVTYRFHGRTMTDYISGKYYHDLNGKPCVPIVYLRSDPCICMVADPEGREAQKRRKKEVR